MDLHTHSKTDSAHRHNANIANPLAKCSGFEKDLRISLDVCAFPSSFEIYRSKLVQFKNLNIFLHGIFNFYVNVVLIWLHCPLL